MPRRYRLKKRAERQDETRKRIVDAAVELHGTVGPARASISAIAERAGVQRLTVYRHFPDERALYMACSGQFQADNPPPDPELWRGIEDPEARLRRALAELYAYYRRIEPMLNNVLRDLPLVPVLEETVEPMTRYLEQIRELLLAGWEVDERRRPLLRAALGHSLDFQTWRSLTRQHELDDAETVELMVGLARSVSDRGTDM
jgi:AcrR family transcriptional regulator